MFTDQEISAICDYRFNLYAKDPGRSQVRPCPRSSLGGTLQAAVRRRDAILRQHLDLVQKTLRGSRSKANENQFALFVSSHTHSANSGFSPFTDPNAPWKPWVVNTGAWQRTVTPSQIDALKNSRRMTDAAVLTLTPEDLAACYPVVIIRPYAGNPESQLLWWRTRASKWSFESTCD
jgi:hypothetical protein